MRMKLETHDHNFAEADMLLRELLDPNRNQVINANTIAYINSIIRSDTAVRKYILSYAESYLTSNPDSNPDSIPWSLDPE
eukprot:732011-Rhodomonas_salina.1